MPITAMHLLAIGGTSCPHETTARRSESIRPMLVLPAMCLLALAPGIQKQAAWKTLKNRGGWSIQYPSSWTPWSCKNCPDLTAPDVYVSFGQQSSKSGIVMVEPLAERPLGRSVAEWLDHTKRSANLNPIVGEDHLGSDITTQIKTSKWKQLTS